MKNQLNSWGKKKQLCFIRYGILHRLGPAQPRANFWHMDDPLNIKNTQKCWLCRKKYEYDWHPSTHCKKSNGLPPNKLAKERLVCMPQNMNKGHKRKVKDVMPLVSVIPQEGGRGEKYWDCFMFQEEWKMSQCGKNKLSPSPKKSKWYQLAQHWVSHTLHGLVQLVFNGFYFISTNKLYNFGHIQILY